MDLQKIAHNFKKHDFSNVSKIDYVQNYLNRYFLRIDEIIHYYQKLLELAGDIKGKTILDIGCGFGFFSILAKECGAKRVIAIDVDTHFCEAARKVSEIMMCDIEVREIPAEDVAKLKDENIDIAFSSCFIEHVYDIKDHFQCVYSALNEKGIYVADTVLHSLNPRSVRRWRKFHEKRELSGDESFFEKRKKFIKEHFPALDDANIVLIAKHLNKFAKNDLKAKVQQYLTTGKLKRTYFDLLYNTCEPYSGYWPDKLMNPFSVKKFGKMAGFDARLMRPIKRNNEIHFPRILFRYLKNGFNSIAPLALIYFYTPQFIVVCRKGEK